MQRTGFRCIFKIADIAWLIQLQATVAQLKTAACALFELEEKDVELSDYYSGKIYANLDAPEKVGKQLEDAQITGPQHILLGEKVWHSMALLQSLSDMSVRICKSSGCAVRMPFCHQLVTCMEACLMHHNSNDVNG